MATDQDILDAVGMKEYKHGFNAGYLLAKHEPATLEKLLKQETKNEAYLRGLKAGAKQAEKEKFLEKLQQDKKKSRDLDRDL
jgi:hypothetical protein